MFGLIGARALYSAYSTKANAGRRGASDAPEVTVQEVKSIPIITSFEAPARVSAKYRVEVMARISGYLTKSYFKEGDFVKAGQLLFEIEPLEYKLAVQQAKGNLDNARAQLTYYEKQLARYQELVDKDYVARSDYDNMLAQRDAYRAQVALYESAYRDAQRNYSYTQVKAPVDGIVLGTYNNRFIAHHWGVCGTLPVGKINYKLLCSYSLNYGTHSTPFRDEQNRPITKKQFSLGLQLTLPENKLPFNTTLNIGFDKGHLLENKFGAMLSISKTGIF